MARQHTSTQNLKSIVGAAFAGLGLVIVFGKLDGPTVQLSDLLGAAAREALELLLCIAPAAWQALQAHAFDHREYSPCPLQMSVSFWPLLRVMAGAV
jgi:ABC-type nitrate/sulfonate/bicarbonate transport system permease component